MLGAGVSDAADDIGCAVVAALFPNRLVVLPAPPKRLDPDGCVVGVPEPAPGLVGLLAPKLKPLPKLGLLAPAAAPKMDCDCSVEAAGVELPKPPAPPELTAPNNGFCAWLSVFVVLGAKLNVFAPPVDVVAEAFPNGLAPLGAPPNKLLPPPPEPNNPPPPDAVPSGFCAIFSSPPKRQTMWLFRAPPLVAPSKFAR